MKKSTHVSGNAVAILKGYCQQALRKYQWSLALMILALSFQPLLSQTNSCAGPFPDPNPSVQRVMASCTNSSTDYLNKYRLQSNYVPATNSPVITLKITFHVFVNAAGTAGPWVPVSAGTADLTQLGNFLHNGYERYVDPRSANYSTGTLCNTNYISDSRINYELTNIYYYYNNTLVTGPGLGQGATLAAHVAGVNPARLDEGLPIFFNSGNMSGAAGYQSSYNGKPYVHTLFGTDPWGASIHLRHEIAHAFSLYHTYQGGGDEMAWGYNCTSPNFLCDVFPINNTMCPSGTLPCDVCFENSTYNSNNLMGTRFGDNLWMSPLQIGRKRMNLHLTSNGIRSFAKEMPSDRVATWNITSNETWDFDIQMYEDIVVKAGATLTLKCKVAMATGGRIIVERGAKLVIDGGEVTAWGGKEWDGIHVWGTSTVRQSVAANGLSTAHGIVDIINGGTVRDAVIGVQTAKYFDNGDLDWGGYFGGIIRCNNANFINNWKAVAYYTYHNKNVLGNNIANMGYFYNSLFETNAILKDAGSPYPDAFISLWEVEGLKFYGNTYRNTLASVPNISNRGNGIYCYDASFLVDRYKVCSVMGPSGCSAYSTNNPSTFSNLYYAISAQNASPYSAISISDNDFVGCNRGVYIGSTLNASITKNRINVGTGLYSMTYLPYGIYLENSSAYKVSNNSIFTTYAASYGLSLATGIFVNGANGLNNVLYRNNFNNMNCGTTVYGDNMGNIAGDGLKFLCNNYGQGSGGQNWADMYMGNNVTTNIPSWMNGKIDKVQGSITQGANNLFSHSIWDFYDKQTALLASSNPTNSFSYYYNPTAGNLTQPLLYDPTLLVNTALATPLNYASMCPETVINPELPHELQKQGDLSGPNSMESVKALIAANTEEMALLSNKLKGSSEKEKENLHAQIAVLNQQRGAAIDEMMRSLLNDSINGVDEAKVIDLLKHDNRPGSQQKLLSAYVATNKLSEASQLISRIKAEEGGKLDEFCQLQELIISMKQNNQNIFAMKTDGALKSQVEEFARCSEEGCKPAYKNAQALMSCVFGNKYNEYVSLPELATSAASNTAKANEQQLFKLYPNPTDGMTHLEIIRPVKYSSLEASVYDITGKLVLMQSLNNQSLSNELTTQHLKSGIYLVVVTGDGAVVEKQKLIKE